MASVVELDIPVELLSTLTVSQLACVVEIQGIEVPSSKLSSQARKKACLEILSCNSKIIHPIDDSAKKYVAKLRIQWWMRSNSFGYKEGLRRLKWVKYVVLRCKEIFKSLGVGVSRGACEACYQKALAHVLIRDNYNACMERTVALYYPPKPHDVPNREAVMNNHVHIGTNRLDIETNGWILELKAIDRELGMANGWQIRNYLRHTEYTEGLLINFNQHTGNVEYCTCFE